MPIMKLCIYPGCRDYAIDGKCYCEKHYVEKRPFQNAKRSNSSLYNTQRWRVLRKKVLAEKCHCEICGDTAEESGFPLEIHHMTCPKGNEELFFMEENLMVLCKRCHARETAAEVLK